MKRVLVPLLAVSALALMAPAAEAQRWPSIRSRAPAFEARVEDGERSGALSQGQADQLRAAFDSLLAREQDYRYTAPGLTMSELQDLDARFDDLSDRLSQALAQDDRGYDRYATTPRAPDFQPPPLPQPPPPEAANPPRDEANAAVSDGWPSMNERRVDFLDRVQKAETSGEVTRSEAAGLRGDFDGLVRREEFYRQDGSLDGAERRDLDMAFAELSRRMRSGGPAPSPQHADVAGAPPPGVVTTPPPPPPAAEEKTRWRDIRNIEADLDERIDEAKEKGVIGEDEAQTLRDQASDLVSVEDDYRASAPGLTHEEVADLEARIASIEDRVGRPPPAKAAEPNSDPPKREQRAVNDFTPL
ncbi:MAG TPA: hypothetical protein VFN88_14180 [Caulobacteraceae bacterium]|nr:hypothetical protein [Caulobacteraceae bacterium]